MEGPSLWDLIRECSCLSTSRGRIRLPEEEEDDQFSLHTSASVAEFSVADTELQRETTNDAGPSPKGSGWTQRCHKMAHSMALTNKVSQPVLPKRGEPPVNILAETATEPKAIQEMHMTSPKKKKKKRKQSQSQRTSTYIDSESEPIPAPETDSENVVEEEAEDVWLTGVVVDPSTFASASLIDSDSLATHPEEAAVDVDADWYTRPSRRHSRTASQSYTLSSSSSGGKRSRESNDTAPTALSMHHAFIHSPPCQSPNLYEQVDEQARPLGCPDR